MTHHPFLPLQRFVRGLPIWSTAVLCCVATPLTQTAAGSIIDQMKPGSAQAAKTHGLKADGSKVITGLLGESAIKLQPLDPPSWEGTRMSFTMKVDPEKPNYFTARFSGDEVTDNRLMLYVDGKQIGWRHLGEVEQLDFGTSEPAYLGRFYYNTSHLPLSLTKGKSEVRCEIRSSGRIWGYGTKFDMYQKPMTTSSRGIYQVYTHTDACFVPPADEKQGEAPAATKIRQSPEAEVFDQIKARVNKELESRLESKKPPSQMQMTLLAKAYDVKWTVAYQNPRAIDQLLKGLDSYYLAYTKNPRLAEEEPSTWNPDWFGLGPCGQVITLCREQLSPFFDQKVPGKNITRREAFTGMLVTCRDWHRLNRRQYTNQTMINDLNGIYLANRGIAVLTPAKALPEPEALRYLYESVGLQPWKDSDPGGKMWNVGDGYMQLTDKGLTKELGYVGTYGEVTDLVTEIYECTRPSLGEPGDAKIKEQLVKIARARAVMRHPSVDAEGNLTMRLEQVVGWRDSHHPGVIAYGQRPTRDASALQAAAATLDPHLVGYAQQLIADNQFFQSEVIAMNDTAQPLRTTIGRLATIDEYERIKSQPPTGHRLPMSWDQPDFVFSDEENGLVAIKNGEEIFYASLYWRARYAVNNLARIHCLTPRFERIAVVRQETEFEPSGLEFTVPNWTNMAFAQGGITYPGKTLLSAHAGEKQLLPKLPAGTPPLTPGDESPYAGRADFYKLRYGHYLIGLNMSKDKTFELKVPSDAKSVKDLVSKRDVEIGSTLKVAPRTTTVLHLQD